MLTTSLPRFRKEIRFALGPFRSLLIGASLICFLLLPVLRCFNSRRISSSRNNSEILGSKLACSSPKLIAACHVLRQYQNQAIHLTACIGFSLFSFKWEFSPVLISLNVIQQIQELPAHSIRSH